jgi:hypothetical protein
MSPAPRPPLIVVATAGLVACGGTSSGPAPDAGTADASTTIDARTTVDAQTLCTTMSTTCDPFLNCGCQASEKCTAGSIGLVCIMAGAQAAGATCTKDTECAGGTFCATFAGATTCLAFCDDGHPCGAGHGCYIAVSDRAGVPTGRFVCGPTCSLLDQDCAGGLGCYNAPQAPEPERGICEPVGSGHLGDSCTQPSDCEKGAGCFKPSSVKAPICAKICDRKDSTPACDVGTTCHALSGDTQTGVCLP